MCGQIGWKRPQQTRTYLASLYVKTAFIHRRRACLRAAASLDDLRRELNRAVLCEQYEKAAILRDEVRDHPENQRSSALEYLKERLKEAIADQNFQAAASIRDEVKKLDHSDAAPQELTYTSVATSRGVRVEATSAYTPTRSAPDKGRFFFIYLVRITNHSKAVVQLKHRRWRITDANGSIEEVRGPGVVGQQPVIGPGCIFEYTSMVVLKTPSGRMEGTYECLFLPSDVSDDEGEVAQVRIAPFLLTVKVVGKVDDA